MTNTIDYVQFAQSYYMTSLLKPKNSVEIIAEIYNLPVSTVKERVRKCRELGYLTSPGKGKSNNSRLTDKAKEILGI